MSLATSADAGRFGPVLPPEFITSTLVRTVFYETEPGMTLVLETDSGPVTLLPWSSSGGQVAAYGACDQTDPLPLELDARELRELLDEYEPEETPLEQTPARPLLGSPGERDVAVSWHARVRWAERVQEETYPAPSIHAALENAVELSRHRGWFNPTLNVRIPVQGPGPIFEDRLDVNWIAKTAIKMDPDNQGFDR